MTENYLIYIHNKINEKTLKEFFFRNKNLTEGISLVDFLQFKGKSDDGEEFFNNAERILNRYSKFQDKKYGELLLKASNIKKELLNDSEFSDLPINIGTKLFIPKENFKEEFVSIKGKNLFLDSSYGMPNIFMSDKLIQLLKDPLYVKSENLPVYGREITAEIINENVRVWIWSRALNKIVNVSPFISSLSTQKSDVGSFNLQLLPIKNTEELMFVDGQDIVSYFPLNSNGKSNIDFFYKNFQQNDIIFIRFEHLQNEKYTKETFLNSLFVDKSKLPGNVWDMIGLIDSVQQSTFFNSNDYILNISGRDFIKLLIEDGSYFLSLRYINNGESNFVFGFDREDKWFKRNIADKNGAGGFVSYYFPYSDRRIDDTIGFIINQLSNIGIITDEDLFSAYGDRRTEQYIVKEGDPEVKVDEVNGVWQIIKVFFDKILENRRLVDSSIAFVDSTILEQFNKVCQKPFVEFYGDTFGDEFNFIVRQPPFVRDSIISFINGTFTGSKEKKSGNDFEVEVFYRKGYEIITLNESDIQGYNNMQWEEEIYSWYQLFPQDAMLGQYSEVMAGGLIPIVYFDKITQIYGNKRMTVNDNYLSANVISSSESEVDKNAYKRALLNDLKFVIDSHSYLPFTRKGTITIPKGDRRIKRGTFIRIAPTNEIFYVDSVSNSINFSATNVDRSTVIQVSRGMIEDYIFGSNGFNEDGSIIKKGDVPVFFSYFDIINFQLIEESRQVTIEPKEDKSNQYIDSNKYLVKIPRSSRIAFENNNPGNLQFANQTGATMGEPRYNKNNEIVAHWAKFETPEDGFIAVINQIKLDAGRGLNLRDFISKYAPNSENKTTEYLEFVKNTLSKSGYEKLSDVDAELLARTICLHESNSIVREKLTESIKVEKAVQNPEGKITKTVLTDRVFYELVEEQFDFFMRRKQFNKPKK